MIELFIIMAATGAVLMAIMAVIAASNRKAIEPPKAKLGINANIFDWVHTDRYIRGEIPFDVFEKLMEGKLRELDSPLAPFPASKYEPLPKMNLDTRPLPPPMLKPPEPPDPYDVDQVYPHFNPFYCAPETHYVPICEPSSIVHQWTPGGTKITYEVHPDGTKTVVRWDIANARWERAG